MYSESGEGTTFRIYWPASKAGKTLDPAELERKEITPGEGTILLVEDEEMVREMATAVLEDAGYHVHVAVSAEEALDLLQRTERMPDLLFSDVVMPGMNGPQLARVLQEQMPDLKILLASGYAEDRLFEIGEEKLSYHFIEKPYMPGELTRKVGRLLNP